MLQDLLLRNVQQQPHAPAIIDLNRQWTYQEILTLSLRYCAACEAAGSVDGEHIAILLANGASAVGAYFGILLAKGVPVPLDIKNPVEWLARQLADCKPACIVSDLQHGDLLGELQHHFSSTVPVIGVTEPLPNTPKGLTSIVNSVDEPERPAVVFYTSGSSGLPKGVMLSHRAILTNTRAIVKSLTLTSNDRIMQILPLAYCYGASLLHTHFAVGGSIVFDHRFSYPAAVLAHMRSTGCTGFAGVPTTLASLAQSRVSLFQSVPSLRYLSCAGGPLDPALADTIRASLQPAQLFIMYGLTEAGARLTCLHPARWDEKRGSVGQAVDGIELRIEGADGNTAVFGEVGEICARGASIMSGYLHAAEATKPALTKGWLHTGDLGYMDREGFLYITGRQSDYIKSQGYRIDPQNISRVILRCPEVTHALTLGIADQRRGERIAALVCLRAGSILDSASLIRYCRERLPYHLCPSQIKIVAELPLLSNGKVNRSQAALLFQEAETETPHARQ